MTNDLKIPSKKVLVLGDSHTIIFGGNTMNNLREPSIFPEVHIQHMGAVLAFNLMEDIFNLGKWGQAIFNGFKLESNKSSNNYKYVILCLGEIDIRTQVVKQAIQQNKSIYDIVNIITEKLINFSILFYNQFKIPILLWEPIASSNLSEKHDIKYPFIGSMKERNLATELFGLFLKEKIKLISKNDTKIFSFGIYDQMSFLYNTLSEFLYDDIHLNLYGLSKALKVLDNLNNKENLDIIQYFKHKLPFHKKPNIKNISEEVTFELSSELNKPSSIINDFNRGYCFHTNEDNKPFIRINLGYSTFIDRIEIFNSKDFKERASSLIIFTGQNLQNLTPLENVQWNNLEETLVINFPKENLIKYIQLQLNEKTFFHLYKINIFKYSIY